MTLTGKQRRHLRGLGHALQTVVTIGKEGVTDAVATALAIALDDHELVKVRVGGTAAVDRKEAAASLASATDSEVAQVLGSTILLYKAHPEKPTIVLPRAASASPA